MKNLFKRGTFISHSGETLHWKIECDALTDEDIETLAELIGIHFSPFVEVIGIPTGGTRIAKALKKYECEAGPTLIVDDVLTTGKSMELYKKKAKSKPAIGVVIFARTNTPRWITPIFRLHSEFSHEQFFGDES